VNSLTKGSRQEIGDNFVHLTLSHSGDTALFLNFLPFLKIALFQLAHTLAVICVEFVFVKFGHHSETRSFKEKVEVLVIFRLRAFGRGFLNHWL
jgi:hypothetical protein